MISETSSQLAPAPAKRTCTHPTNNTPIMIRFNSISQYQISKPRVSLWQSALASILFSLCCTSIYAQKPESYPVHPDAEVKPGVPQGKVEEFEWESKVFEGTRRRYAVYVPAQYDAAKPAAVMVFQDGHSYQNPKGDFRATVVMDNLIHEGAMPVTIGIFIDPGTKGPLPEKRGWQPAPSNRSFEYDTLSDQYARFLIDEILPEVGKKYKLTDDPEQRAIAGQSSGGICAWTVAWEKPNHFRKVVSHIGSFVNIRGGHNCEALIRKTPKKPIRVFLQDGSGDLDNEHGNWPLANQEMAKSLAFKGYDYKFVYGEGAHNGKHGGSIFPDTLRWLWRTTP